MQSCEYAATHRLVHAGACKKIRTFSQLITGLQEQAKDIKLSELYHNILDKTDYVIKLKGENTPEAMARIDNLEEFNNAIMQFEKERGDEASLQSFLEEMALVSDVDNMDESEHTVTLMTLHISKGLEFPNVFIVGMEEGLFPSARSYEGGDPDALEEERRLAYVGMTRAKENLFLTYARTRRVWGQEQSHPPSRFITEIPEKYLKSETSIRAPKFISRSNYGKPKHVYDDFDTMPDYENFSNEYSDEASGYNKGMKVRHPTFGAGTIYSVEGKGEMQKVGVLFQNKTLKKFVIKYARLEII